MSNNYDCSVYCSGSKELPDDVNTSTVHKEYKKLDYTIHKYSGYSTTFVPSNIMEDKSKDQTSRWLSDSNNSSQYITLKLNRLSIVRYITFGKYEKTHVCNLKKFKIYGGLSDNKMMELLEGGLRNDSVPETFELKYMVDGQPFPCRYIKVVPLQAWGPSFNFSIWYVELTGINDMNSVKMSLDCFNKLRAKEAVKLCLKHLRNCGHYDAFRLLQQCTGVRLEHPLLSELYTSIIVNGDYLAAEELINSHECNGLFSLYVSQQEYQAIWRPLQSEGLQPGQRGGHQMCLDPHTETIYLLGGWDGYKDLNDLWAYHIPTKQWRLISKDTEAEGGPSPRSCHKLCIDPERRQIFTLGRYLDTPFRIAENLKSDFYMYDIECNQWTLITEDTSTYGGPQLVFDHQMSMDVENRVIYVFGGKVFLSKGSSETETGNKSTSSNCSDHILSGLYSYHVSSNTWKQLSIDPLIQPTDDSGFSLLKSRAGHTMVFHPIERKLYIFAGQRSKNYMNDFFSYNVNTGEVDYIYDGQKSDLTTLPAAGFTQRATIDTDLDEIYVLSGLSKDKEKRDVDVQNSFWVYYMRRNKWKCVYRNEEVDEQYWIKMQNVEPCPRFAHQLVYDNVNKVHYLFGGNPGRPNSPKLRLDDFWMLNLRRPTNAWLSQKCRVLIRKYRFQELSLSGDRIAALNYLQTSLSEIIDHNDPQQTSEFQSLASFLFLESVLPQNDDFEDESSSIDLRNHRLDLFEELCKFFPTNLTQPKTNLIDITPLL